MTTDDDNHVNASGERSVRQASSLDAAPEGGGPSDFVIDKTKKPSVFKLKSIVVPPEVAAAHAAKLRAELDQDAREPRQGATQDTRLDLLPPVASEASEPSGDSTGVPLSGRSARAPETSEPSGDSTGVSLSRGSARAPETSELSGDSTGVPLSAPMTVSRRSRAPWTVLTVLLALLAVGAVIALGATRPRAATESTERTAATGTTAPATGTTAPATGTTAPATGTTSAASAILVMAPGASNAGEKPMPERASPAPTAPARPSSVPTAAGKSTPPSPPGSAATAPPALPSAFTTKPPF